MKHWYGVAIVLTGLLGAGHVCCTPVYTVWWTEASAWFAGTGLALVLLAAINGIALACSGRRVVWLAVFCTNLIMLLFICGVAQVVPEIQAFMAVVLFVWLTLHSLVAMVWSINGEHERT